MNKGNEEDRWASDSDDDTKGPRSIPSQSSAYGFSSSSPSHVSAIASSKSHLPSSSNTDTSLRQSQEQSQYEGCQALDEKRCSSCMSINNGNDAQCKICSNSRRPKTYRSLVCKDTDQSFVRPVASMSESSPHPSCDRKPSATDTEIDFVENSSSILQTSTPTSAVEAIVYIPDLPADEDDANLEQLINKRLKTDHHIDVTKVQCHSSIGVGILFVSNDTLKNTLVHQTQSAIVDPRTKTCISFVEQLELVSYVVFDPQIKGVNTPDEVARRWATLIKLSKPPTCEQVSVQFPNIFKLVSSSLDELLTARTIDMFAINGQFANIYLRADCSFFEDLPLNTTTDQITTAINAQIGDRYDKKTLYVQYNKGASSAIVLAVNNARKWANMNLLSLNSHICRKKTHLAFRIVVYPVPRSLPIDLITQHRQFQNAVTKQTQTGDKLVIELNDKSVYDESLKAGVLHVASHSMHIDPYTTIGDDSENSEINVENWYETQMLDFRSDIMQFMIDPQHFIFQYQWNAQIWLEQFKSVDRIQDQESDKKRRLLRVTTMLNTIGVVRKKCYLAGTEDNRREVKLDAKQIQTIVYNHQSELIPRRDIFSAIIPPYPSTTVEVVNNDCLVVYEALASAGNRPLLLNMANSDTPGGGYRQGAAAQEENLFRRSDYYLSLDVELDDMKRTERFWCTENAKQKCLELQEKMYPIEEFGAIYTSGITVFRDIEGKGYSYLEQPIYNVCVIALAAYNQPALKRKDNTLLTNKNAVGTRKKIENLFAIAHKHGHDCLVLSALGCGAFKNPPSHVASIFKSVIEQYAGYFKTIHFAIIDDHNTGNQRNPHGNYRPFKDTLDGLSLRPSIHELDVNMISGPFKIISKTQGKMGIDEVCIFALPLCPYAAECRELENVQHCQLCSHPPLCSQHGSCDQVLKDEVHKNSFIHPIKRQYGGQRKQIRDEEHRRQVDQSQLCSQADECRDMSEDHQNRYRHLLLRKDSLTNCLLFRKDDREHYHSDRHSIHDCSFGGNCVNFHDEEHIKDQSHPFNPPCPLTPFTCGYHAEFLQAKRDSANKVKRAVEEHCISFSHVCPFGRQCTDTTDLHARTSIHIVRKMCPDSDQCSKITNEEHLNSFSHPNVWDIRHLCNYPGSKCHDQSKSEHMKRFRHYHNCDDLSVVRYFDLNTDVNFVRNQYEMIKTVRSYVESNNWKKSNTSIPREITEWIRALQPVHRCNRIVFESILVHGNVMSRDYMNMLYEPNFVVHAIEQHNVVRQIFDHYNSQALQQHVRDFIRALVHTEFSKTFKSNSTYGNQYKNTPKMEETHLEELLKLEEIKTIRERTIEIVQASLQHHGGLMGIGHPPEVTKEANKHVFSILGPHLSHSDGDIFIIFKRELMHHPDANFSIQAATTYRKNASAYQLRPWLTDPGSAEARINNFHRSKLHCCIPGFEEAAALELMALTGLKNKTMDVNLNDIQYRWARISPDEVFEAHLPQLIPLDYIDHIYIPKDVFRSMTSAAQQEAKNIFGSNRLKITEHHADLNAEKQMESTRISYQNCVIDEIRKKLAQSHLHELHGTHITLPASKLQSFVAIPITISQSCDQYRLQKGLSGIVFIYWQAMGGDMMLTLSSELLDPNFDQSKLQCLMSYIAETPSNNVNATYHESYSYVTCGLPSHHNIIVQDRHRMKAMSNAFYRGCNIHDYITYCLIIRLKKNEVILTHAGSNSIYNHQKIVYTFSQSELDLSKLDHIYLSAGTRIVSVRNLIIRHEPIDEYHASFDKEFKQSDQATSTTSKYASASGSQPSSPDEQPLPKVLRNQPNNKSFNNGKSPSLLPCHNSVNCLLQYSAKLSKEHNEKYSHPCRFSELCRSPSDHPHLEHIPHLVPDCKYDKKCYELGNPVHRAQYRHPDLPDYLVPCRDQRCRNFTLEHRIKYSHGEKVLLPSSTDSSEPSSTPRRNPSVHAVYSQYPGKIDRHDY